MLTNSEELNKKLRDRYAFRKANDPEYAANRREKDRLRYAEDKGKKAALKRRKYKDANPEFAAECSRRDRARHGEARRKYLNQYFKEHPKYLESSAKANKENIKNLTAGYVKQALGFSVKADIPEDLINLKREQIEIFRLRKELKKVIGEENVDS